MTRRNLDDYLADDGPDGDDDTLARNVARLRRAHGMKQSDLALAMREQGQGHWHQNTVSRVENRRQRLTGGEVMALQKVLGPEVIDGTELAGTIRAAYPRVREEAARRALAEAEQALAQALSTVRELRALYSDDGEG